MLKQQYQKNRTRFFLKNGVLFLFSLLILVVNVRAEKYSYLSPNKADSLKLIYDNIEATAFPTIVSLVTVTNDAGFVVGKLDENNFSVFENDVRELPITVEELEANEAGFNVVLAIDRSGSMRGDPLADAKIASSTFIDLMQVDDLSAITSFAQDPRTDNEFSNDKAALQQAIDGIESQGGTAIFDALIHSANIFAAEMTNRAIILLTDGADKDSHTTYDDAVATCSGNSVKLFTIGLGLNTGSEEEKTLRRLATATGGLYFNSPNSSELEAIYRAISLFLHHRYRITYTTHNPSKDSTLRRVQLEVTVNEKASSDTASYRAPYEAPPDPPDPPAPPAPPDPPPPPEPPAPPLDPPPEPPEIPIMEQNLEVIPNPFTPNGDGLNDQVEFRRGEEIPASWIIRIMDRQGQVIRQLTDGARYWDGKDENGNLQFPGCFLFMISEENRVLHRGLVNLVR